MADENKPQDSNEHKNEHQDHTHEQGDDKVDFKKVHDKYNELKSHPKVKATKGLFSNHFFEIFYLVAVVIAFIISLTRPGNGGLIFTGIGFLVGLFMFSIIHGATRKISHFLTKQELVVHIILAIIFIILSFIIPTIMMGVLVGLPAGFGVRHWIDEINSHMKSGH